MALVDDDGPMIPRVYMSEMDLRDYFAAKAMQSVLLASLTSQAVANELMLKAGPSESGIREAIAIAAYQTADAMLEARKVRP